jgi:hypothetical protein
VQRNAHPGMPPPPQRVSRLALPLREGPAPARPPAQRRRSPSSSHDSSAPASAACTAELPLFTWQKTLAPASLMRAT